MRSITFNKKKLGEWRRDDGELKKSVNEEAMFREISKLMNDGWMVVRTEGITHVQMIEMTKK